jgi:hypothetical protein
MVIQQIMGLPKGRSAEDKANLAGEMIASGFVAKAL